MSDPDTEEVIFAARIESAPAPREDGWEDVAAVSARDVANRLLALSASHSLTLPTNEEQVAALEHLLLLGTPPQQTPVPDGGTASAAHGSTARVLDEPANPVPHTAVALSERPMCDGLQVGDLVLCTLPLSRRGRKHTAPRPGLVVGIRSLLGRRYLDVAWGGPPATAAIAPPELAVLEAPDVATAQLTGPTRFDMRRRFLIAEDDRTRVHRRLGTLSVRLRGRIREALLLAGDVTPAPVGTVTPSRSALVEFRVRKSYFIPPTATM